jgi:Cu+-exporting ATPase
MPSSHSGQQANEAIAPHSAQATLLLHGMSCASCAARIQQALRQAQGVIDAQVNFAAEKVLVAYRPDRIDVPALQRVVADAGYVATLPAPAPVGTAIDPEESQP